MLIAFGFSDSVKSGVR